MEIVKDEPKLRQAARVLAGTLPSRTPPEVFLVVQAVRRLWPVGCCIV
jgi:hypothetical protein